MLEKDHEIAHRLHSIEQLVKTLLAYQEKTSFRENPFTGEFLPYLRMFEEVTKRCLEDTKGMSHRTRDLEESFKLLVKHVSKTAKIVDVIEKAQDFIKQELHTFLVAQSLGLDINNMPFYRIIPVRVYLSEADEKQIGKISEVINNLTKAFGFEISDDFPPETGSWFKRWFAKTKKAVTQPEVKERLRKIERALELKGVHQIQSEIDKNEAEAAASLIKAMDNVPNGAVQVGSLLLFKIEDPQGKTCLQARTLNPSEMIYLEKNQNLLSSPHEILEKLSEYNQKQDKKGLPPTVI